MSYDFIFNISEVGLLVGIFSIAISSHLNLSKRIDNLYQTVIDFIRRGK
jgi:hypothetical protein